MIAISSKPTRYTSSNFKEITSTSNQELIPPKPVGWTVGHSFRKVSFLNENKCTIIINNKDIIRISAGRGFEMSYDDPPINSFVVVEEGIVFELIATY